MDSDTTQIYAWVGGVLVTWLVLTLAACFSMRWSIQVPAIRRPLSIIFALIALVLGAIFFKARIEWVGENNHFRVDLSWLFLLPLVLGTVSLVLWARARRQNAQTSQTSDV